MKYTKLESTRSTYSHTTASARNHPSFESDQQQIRELAQAAQESESDKSRLDEVFASIDVKPDAMRCRCVIGLLRDCRHITENDASERIRDASLIAAAQFIQHNEIARYTAAYRWAQTLKHEAARSLLKATLDEEACASASLECLAAVVNESVLLARQT